MADDNSHVSRTLDDIRAQVLGKLDEARAALAALNSVEMMFGQTPTSLSELLGEAPPTAVTAATSPQSGQLNAPVSVTVRHHGAKPVLRADSFLGEDPMAAAKKYMAMVGHAIDFDEIADAVQRGGAAIKGANWREALEGSLMRSPYEVIKVSEKTYGLATFYSEEQLNRLRAARRDRRGGRGQSGKKKTSKASAKSKKTTVVLKTKNMTAKSADKKPTAKMTKAAPSKAEADDANAAEQVH